MRRDLLLGLGRVGIDGEELADECYAQMERNYNRIKARAGKMSVDEGDEDEVWDDEEEEVAEDREEAPDAVKLGELRGISERLDHIRSKSVSVLQKD